MKKRIFLFMLGLVLSLVLITISASGEAAMNADDTLSRMFDTVYLVCNEPSILNTEEYSIELSSADLFAPVTLSGKKPDSGSVEFVGGNKELKDLVVWIEDQNTHTSLVGIITHNFSVPGEAVFRVSAAAGKETFEKDYTLRIIPFSANTFSIRSHDIRLMPGMPLTAGDLIPRICSMPPELTGTPVEHFAFTGNAGGKSISMKAEDIAARIQSGQSELTGTVSFQIANASVMLRNITIGPEGGMTGPADMTGSGPAGMTGPADMAGPGPANMTGPADNAGPGPANMIGPADNAGPGPAIMTGPADNAGPGPAGMSGPGDNAGPGPGPGGNTDPGPGNMSDSDGFPPDPEAEEAMDRLFSIPYFAKAEWRTEIQGDNYIIRFSQTEPGSPIYLSGEMAESGSVTFLSGDDFLQNIIYWHYDHGTPFVSLAAQSLPSDRPGEAVFHIAAKTAAHSFEKDYTLRVIAYPDDAFELTGQEILVSQSEEYTEDSIVQKICRFAPVLADCGVHNVIFRRDSDRDETDWMEIVSDMLSGRASETKVTGTLSFELSNAQFTLSHISFRLNPYRIDGPVWISPGQEAVYTVVSAGNGTSLPKDFILTAECAELSPDGKLIPNADAKIGNEILVTASSAEAGITFTKTVKVSNSPLNELYWTLEEVDNLSVPLPSGKGWTITPASAEGSDPVRFKTGSRGKLENSATTLSCEYEISVYLETDGSDINLEDLIRDAEARLRVYRQPEDLETGMLFVNGYPVLYCVSASYSPGGGANIRARISGRIGNKDLSFTIQLFGPQAADDAPVPDLEFIAGMLGRILIDGQPVTVTSAGTE